jgi:hypothetical protein
MSGADVQTTSTPLSHVHGSTAFQLPTIKDPNQNDNDSSNR